LYRQLLDKEPGNFVALHQLGLVLIRRGMHAPGIELVRKARTSPALAAPSP
jgi:hypothetical protein